MTNIFSPGDRVKLRLLGGQIVDAGIVQPGRFRSLVQWGVITYWDTPGDMGPDHQKAAWRSNHRLWKECVR